MGKINDEFFMARALRLAERAWEAGEVPVGAVLVAGEEVLGEGWNRPIACCDPTAHAEIVAIREASKKVANYRLPGSTLYVTLEPCLMCAGAIVQARIERVVFGAFDAKGGHALALSSFNHRPRYEGGCLEERCAGLIRDFFKARR